VTNDEYFASLRRDWLRDPPSRDTITRGFAHHRRWALWSAAGNLLGAIVVLAACVWVARMAFAGHDTLLDISALAFAVAVPVILFGLVALRRRLRLVYDQTSLGLLRQTRDRVETMRRMLVGARWCAAILAAAAMAVGLLAATAHASPSSAFLLIPLWSGTAAAVWLWQIWRARDLANRVAHLDAIIAEFESVDR